MSLVNDMLKALEEREGGTAIENGDVCSPMQREQYSSSDGDRLSFIYRSSIAVLILALTISLSFWLFANTVSPKLSPTISPPAFSGSTVVVKKPSESIQQPDSDNLPLLELQPLQDTVVAALTTDNDDDATQRINQLLREAKLALVNNRLTDPIDDNAYSRLQAVLLLDPSHSEALSGVQTIVERYVDFARQTNERGQLRSAKSYWSKAELIAAQYPPVNYWLEQQRSSMHWNTLPSTTAPIESPNTSKVVQQQEAIDKPAATERQQLSVELSSKSRDEKISGQAKSLIARQRLVEAEQLLVQAIAENPSFTASPQILFGLYAQQKNQVAAEQVLGQIKNLSAPKRALMQARLAVELQQWPNAALLLEKDLQGAGNDTEYLALLAAVYHQLGRYRDAATQYQQLLNINDRNGAYWLGLAVSFDAIADKTSALRAFRYARLHGGLDATTFTYVEQRIDTLSASSSAG